MAGGDSDIRDGKYCVGCAAYVHRTARMCPKCGAPQSGHGRTSGSEKSRITAGVLALLVGGLGIHKFYLEQTGLGIVYLIFCWTFIPAIVAFIEGIIYLTMSDDAFEAKYVNVAR